MKAIIFFISFVTVSAYAQVSQYNELDINNVKANIIPNADFIGNFSLNSLAYQVPKNANIPSVTKASLWIGGYVNQQLRIAAMTYRQNGQDFWTGPLDTANVTIDQNTSTDWDKSWRINVFEIDSFITNYSNGNVANGSYVIPQNIATWPGNGNALLNQAKQLAPYVDLNNDGIYNPTNGDYPKIKGDQAIWFVFNDMLGNHMESGSVNKIGLEVHAMAYAYFCPTIPDSSKAINNTTFYEFQIFNRSSNIIDSTIVGIWMDTDLGYYYDDYVGCDVTNNYAYIYNGDNFDESANGALGYGNNLAFQAIQILKGPTSDLNNSIDNDHDGCIDCTFGAQYTCDTLNGIIPETTLREEIKLSGFTSIDNHTGQPTSSGNGLQFYNFLNGKWRNGDYMRYDSNFGMTTSTSFTRCTYLYPGMSDPYGYGVGGSAQVPVTLPVWSETSAGNPTGDRKMLLNMGKFTFMPQTSKTLEFAIVTSRLDNNSGNNLDFTNMNNDTRKIREWYACNNFPSCVGNSNFITQPTESTERILAYPNPATNEVNVNFNNNKGAIKRVSVINSFGLEVKSELSNADSISIKIENLSPGIYQIQIIEGETVRTLRFIKN